MLTENTQNAFLCIELIDESRDKEFKAAIDELANLARKNLGGEFKISVLDINNKEIFL